MASRSKLARLGAVVGAAAAVVMAGAIPAGADPVAQAASGKVDGDGVGGYSVNLGEQGLRQISTSLIGFRLADGTKLGMYCVEIHTNIDRKGEMVEQPWDAYPNPQSPFNGNRDKINWVLHNGYPVASTDALAALLAKSGATLNDGLSTREAITATQAAVWHFSDATNLDTSKPLNDGDDAAAADVVALYKYLIGDANVGIGDQPTPRLEVNPSEASGNAGKRVGPFTVKTTGTVDELKADLPAGVKVTDADGNPLSANMIKNGTQLFLDVPASAAPGSGTFELTASASIDTGRLFVGKDYAHKPTQSLIVAQAEASKISVKAGGKWAAAKPAPQGKNTPKPALAETGASITVPVVLGVVLIGAGAGSLLFLRQRRRA